MAVIKNNAIRIIDLEATKSDKSNAQLYGVKYRGKQFNNSKKPQFSENVIEMALGGVRLDGARKTVDFPTVLFSLILLASEITCAAGQRHVWQLFSRANDT